MSILLNSFFLILASEMGDKTQLLALVLASRFRKPWTVLSGIFVATLLNHALASKAGEWISTQIPRHFLIVGLAVIFFAFAIWILIPDRDEGLKTSSRFGAFVTTTIAFFLAEMGDKTQLATVALGAHYANTALVTLGTTLGMLAANGLAVFFGDRLTRHLSMTWIRRGASVLFAIFGVLILLQL